MTKEAVRTALREANAAAMAGLDWDRDIPQAERDAILLDCFCDFHAAAVLGNLSFVRTLSAERTVQLRGRVYTELAAFALRLLHQLGLEEGMTN